MIRRSFLQHTGISAASAAGSTAHWTEGRLGTR
ncbi:MAG: twin-arginine translocation signal domain-containing protein [Bacteroidetes bacterium]|nr:twin-arginine translocation signal domain-containing protein [Bacteroidota bacterium]